MIRIQSTRKGYKRNPEVGNGYRYKDLFHKRVQFSDGVKGTIATISATFFEVYCNDKTWRKGTVAELGTVLCFCE